MSDEYDLVSLLEELRGQCTLGGSVFQGDENQSGLELYMQRPFSGDPDYSDDIQRSRYVSGDVAEVVDWELPRLIVAMMPGSDVVTLISNTTKDEKKIRQINDVMQQQFFIHNDGDKLLHDFIKDGLIERIGIMTVEKCDIEYGEEQQFSGDAENPEEFEAFSQEVISGQYQATMGEGATVNYRMPNPRRIKFKCWPPEDFFISPAAQHHDQSLPDGPDIIGVRERLRRSECQKMWPKYKEQIELESHGVNDTKSIAGDGNLNVRYFDESLTLSGSIHRPNDKMLVIRHWVHLDGALRHVVTVGDIVVHDEEVKNNPFSLWTPNRIPHRNAGISLADEARSFQVSNSTLIRNALDNVIDASSPMIIASKGSGVGVLEDIMNVASGRTRIIRTESSDPNDLRMQTIPDTAIGSFNAMNILDGLRERRTGVGKMQQGIDPQIMNKTATVGQIMNDNSSARTSTRLFLLAIAIGNLFVKAFDIMAKEEQPPIEVLSDDGEKFQSDPAEWPVGVIAKIHVGSNSSRPAEKMQHLQAIAAFQKEIITAIPGNPMVTPSMYIETLQDLARLMGERNPAKRFKRPPDEFELPEQQDPNAQKIEAQQLLDTQTRQADIEKSKAELELKRQEMIQGFELKREQLAAEIELKREIAFIQSNSGQRTEINLGGEPG